jgi:hypothetical protein
MLNIVQEGRSYNHDQVEGELLGRTPWTNSLDELLGRTPWTNSLDELLGRTPWTNSLEHPGSSISGKEMLVAEGGPDVVGPGSIRPLLTYDRGVERRRTRVLPPIFPSTRCSPDILIVDRGRGIRISANPRGSSGGQLGRLYDPNLRTSRDKLELNIDRLRDVAVDHGKLPKYGFDRF